MPDHPAEIAAETDQGKPDRAVGSDGDVASTAVRERRARGRVVHQRGGSDVGIHLPGATPGREPEIALRVGGDVAHPRRAGQVGMPDDRIVDIRNVDPAVLRLQELRDAALFHTRVIAADPGIAVRTDVDRVVEVALDAGVRRTVIAPGGPGNRLRESRDNAGSEQRQDGEKSNQHADGPFWSGGNRPRTLRAPMGVQTVEEPRWNDSGRLWDSRLGRAARQPPEGRGRSG